MVKRRLRKDLTGTKVGKLTVFSVLEERNSKLDVQWNCQCECGTKKVYTTSALNRVKSCGCGVKNFTVDYSGQSYNELKILRRVGKNKYSCWVYEVECKCGKTFTAEANDIKTSKIRSCGCRWYNRKTNEEIKISLISSLQSQYIQSAKARGYSYKLSRKQFEDYIFQNCFYCGAPPSNIKKLKYFEASLCYNGIDRIDNKKGYEPDNVAPCCKICNLAKRELSSSQFFEHIVKIFKHQSSPLSKFIERELKATWIIK